MQKKKKAPTGGRRGLVLGCVTGVFQSAVAKSIGSVCREGKTSNTSPAPASNTSHQQHLPPTSAYSLSGCRLVRDFSHGDVNDARPQLRPEGRYEHHEQRLSGERGLQVLGSWQDRAARSGGSATPDCGGAGVVLS